MQTMFRRALSLVPMLLVCAIACTAKSGEPPQIDPGPVPQVGPVPHVEEPQQRQIAPMPVLADDFRAPNYWQWDSGSGWGESLANQVEIRTSDATYRIGYFSTKKDAHDGPFGVIATSPDGGEQWRVKLDELFVGEGKLAFDGETLYATHHGGISSGARASAIDVADGSIAWTVTLEGLGPIGHSKYRNETQIEVDDRGVVVYGRESQGAYTEILDPKTGAQRRLSFPDARFVGLMWTGKGAEAPFDFKAGPSQLLNGTQTYTATYDEDARAITIKLRNKGVTDPAWSKTLESTGCGNSALWTTTTQKGTYADTLWVADYCGISSGVQLHKIEAGSGELQHSSYPRGMGMIAHSEYFNETTLTEMHGHLVVHGREAAGNYLEVVDPASGLSVANLTFRDE